MLKIIRTVCLICFGIILISSCNDSLGINGAYYVKSTLQSDTLYIDTMINFKKVIIEKIITKNDTTVVYIPVNQTYDNVYSNRKDFNLTEYFHTILNNPMSEDLSKSAKVNITSFLNYNPLTPVINYQMIVDNSDALNELNTFKYRPHIINSIKLVINNLSVLSDEPTSFRVMKNNSNASVEIEMIDNLGRKKLLNPDLLLGEFVISDRLVIKGQIRSLQLNGYFMVPAKERKDVRDYWIDFRCKLQFPEF